MDCRFLVAELVRRLGAEQFGEEPVVAIPGRPRLVRDEEVPSLELRQRPLAVVLAGKRVRELAADAAAERGLEQELARRAVLTRQDLVHEIVGDGALGLVEAVDEGSVVLERREECGDEGGLVGLGDRRGIAARTGDCRRDPVPERQRIVVELAQRQPGIARQIRLRPVQFRSLDGCRPASRDRP